MKKQQILAAVSAGLISLGMVGSVDAALVGLLAVTPGGTDGTDNDTSVRYKMISAAW